MRKPLRTPGACGPGGRRRIRWGVLATAGALAVMSACTLEERPDRPAEREDPSEEPDVGLAAELSEDPADATAADSVRAVASAFRDALEMGDLSSALQLVDRDAVVFDRMGGDPPEGASTGEVLLREIRLRRDGLNLEPLDSQLTFHGDVAVEVTRAEPSWEGGEDRAGIHGPVLETMVLVRTEDGWRLGHLHRSAAPGGG